MELKSEIRKKILIGNFLSHTVIVVLITLWSLVVLGFIGFRTILGFLIIMFLPFYIILSNFEFIQEEKVIFSLFLSITFYPSLVYWLGFIIPFKISVFVVFIILLAIFCIIKKFYKKSKLLKLNIIPIKINSDGSRIE